MTSRSEINAEQYPKDELVELENCHLTIHIGVFFGGNADYPIQSTWVASNYDIEEDECNRKYTVVINESVYPTVEEQFDENGMMSFGNRMGAVLYDVFNRLHNLLSGYLSFASNLSIEIDTFCIEEGFFCASMFCEAVQKGCFDELPQYAPYALCDVLGGGILEDLRMRGANITLNSFTTFQTMPNAKTDSKQSTKEKSYKQKKDISQLRIKANTSHVQSEELQYYDSPEYIRMEEDYSLFKISVQKSRFEGLYSKLCNVSEWLEYTALACDIVAVASSLSLVGAMEGAVCEVASMGLNAINVVVCFTLAGMASVDGNIEARNQHLENAGWNAVGTLPLGSIIAKSAKSVKFFTKKNTIKLLDNASKSVSESKKIAKLHPKEPYLKGLDTNSTNNASKVVVKSKRPQLKVIQGGKMEGEWVKVANGSEVFVPKITYQSNNVFLNSFGEVGGVNNWGICNSSKNFVIDGCQSINGGSIFDLAKTYDPQRQANLAILNKEGQKYLALLCLQKIEELKKHCVRNLKNVVENLWKLGHGEDLTFEEITQQIRKKR